MERTERFVKELENNDCEVHVVDRKSLKENLVNYIGKGSKVFYRPSALIKSLGLRDIFELTEDFHEGIYFGLSEADYGIVYSGGLVELANTREEKLPSLLPEVHVALLREENIVEDFDDLFSRLQKPLPDITFITGPSKTADIEKILVRGAHGPRKLIVFIVANEY